MPSSPPAPPSPPFSAGAVPEAPSEALTFLCALRSSREHLCDAEAASTLQALIDVALMEHCAVARPVWAWRPAPLLLAGGALPETLCSVLGGAGGGGSGAQQLLSFLDYFDAFQLRLVCREACEMVGECQSWHKQRRQQWPPPASAGSVIQGSLERWRAVHPQALRANVSALQGARPLHSEDCMRLMGLKVVDMSGAQDKHFSAEEGFLYLRGLHTLSAKGCKGITEAALAHLKGIHTLDISSSSGQQGIFHPTLGPLAGINTLNISGCILGGEALGSSLKSLHTLVMQETKFVGQPPGRAPQPALLFAPLESLRTLDISSCSELCDAHFEALKGITTLRMDYCSQQGISDAALSHLSCLESLSMRGCKQITGEGFRHLSGLRSLVMSSCDSVVDASFGHLKGLSSLDISRCTQLTDAALQHLSGSSLASLTMIGCSQAGLSDAAFSNLRGLRHLNMSACSQLSDSAFAHLRGLQSLVMRLCPQPAISDAAFSNLSGIQALDLSFCTQSSISDEAFRHLLAIKSLQVDAPRAAGPLCAAVLASLKAGSV